jgi:hypothetical protein
MQGKNVDVEEVAHPVAIEQVVEQDEESYDADEGVVESTGKATLSTKKKIT